MLRRILYIAFVVIVLGVILNDAIKYSRSQKHLTETSVDLITYAADQTTRPRDTVAGELATMGQQAGVRVTMYGQTDKGVQLWTEADVTGTVFVGPVYNMVLGKPFAEAWSTPLVIKSYRTAGPH